GLRVEHERRLALAELAEQDVGGGEGRVPAQVDLDRGREPAELGARRPRPHEERGLREPVLVGDALKEAVLGPALEGDDRGGIAAERPVGERVDPVYRKTEGAARLQRFLPSAAGADSWDGAGADSCEGAGADPRDGAGSGARGGAAWAGDSGSVPRVSAAATGCARPASACAARGPVAAGESLGLSAGGAGVIGAGTAGAASACAPEPLPRGGGLAPVPGRGSGTDWRRHPGAGCAAPGPGARGFHWWLPGGPCRPCSWVWCQPSGPCHAPRSPTQTEQPTQSRP